VRTAQRWEATLDGEVLGRVELLEIEDPVRPIRMYRAVTRSGQWLGYVDEQGRVFQRVPFEDREVFRGVYPMAEGLALLYEVDGKVGLAALAPSTADRDAAEATIRFPAREDR
jgi:hypothetical protein